MMRTNRASSKSLWSRLNPFRERRPKPAQATRPRSLRVEILEARQLLSVTWTGAALDNQYDSTANWSTGTVPTAGDDVVVPIGSNMIVAGNEAANSLIVGGGTTLQGNNPSATYALSTGNLSGVASGSAVPVVAVNLTGTNGLNTQGTVQLSTADSYSGGTNVGPGTLIATTASAVPCGTNLTVGADGTFDYDPARMNWTPVFQRAVPDRLAPDTTAAVSAAGTLYADGAAILSGDDLGLGTTRTYSSRYGSSQYGGLGPGWTLVDQPYVVSGRAQIDVVFSPTDCYFFTASGTSYRRSTAARRALPPTRPITCSFSPCPTARSTSSTTFLTATRGRGSSWPATRRAGRWST